MENVKEILKQTSEFLDFSAKRGKQLIMAGGYEHKLYDTPDEITCDETSMDMVFRENTNHDCPDTIGISLSLSNLEKTDEEWNIFIAETVKKTQTDKEIKIKEKQEAELNTKMLQFNKLKKELNL